MNKQMKPKQLQKFKFSKKNIKLKKTKNNMFQTSYPIAHY